jgi:hypothetical protein
MPTTLEEKLMIRPPLRYRTAASRMVVEAALEIHRDLPVKGLVPRFGQWREAHDRGVVDEDIDATELGFGRIEQGTDRFPR